MRLQTRLFVMFGGAILLAATSSVAIYAITAPEPVRGPNEVMARGVAGRLAKLWDDPPACDAYLETVREATGLGFELVRDPRALPQGLSRPNARGAIVFERGRGTYIPIVRRTGLVGAVHLEGDFHKEGPLRLVLAFLFAAGCLALLARWAARAFSRPLEAIAEAADRFGRGELSARVESVPGGRTEEVVRVSAAFDRMAARVEELVRDQRALLGAVSHELRSPLGRARVALEIARERPGDPKPMHDVEKALMALDTILGDLLTSARVGLGDVQLVPQPFFAWLRGALVSEESPPVLECPEGEGATVAVDAKLLERALSNLLANARVHGRPKDDESPLIVVRAGEDAAKVTVSVVDAGAGFERALLPRVFEPFVRGGAARAHGQGVGLGLALVRRIVEAHGGEAFARNRADGAGAVTGFSLPICRDGVTGARSIS